MAESIIQKAGGGAESDECTAEKAQVLVGYTALTKDSDDEPVAGTMPNQGAKTATLNCGGSYTIPAGYHNGSGKVSAKSLASQTGGATASDGYVYNGKTYWKDGVLRTGNMSPNSVVSFSAAAYSVSQVLLTWTNPASGPFSGFLICAKAGSYPTNAWDGITYQGTANNSGRGANSYIFGGLTAGTTYYFRIWTYLAPAGIDTLYSGHQQAVASTGAHGRTTFTVGGTFVVPANVRTLTTIKCKGGGASGRCASNYSNDARGGAGGGSGYESVINNIAVSPGETLVVLIGAGGPVLTNQARAGAGGTTSVSRNGTILVSANGGEGFTGSITADPRTPLGGATQGGVGAYAYSSKSSASTSGGRDAGGGGGAVYWWNSGEDERIQYGSAGNENGGHGAYRSGPTAATPGADGTGAGGGGGGINTNNGGKYYTYYNAGAGGSGYVIIEW